MVTVPLPSCSLGMCLQFQSDELIGSSHEFIGTNWHCPLVVPRGWLPVTINPNMVGALVVVAVLVAAGEVLHDMTFVDRHESPLCYAH